MGALRSPESRQQAFPGGRLRHSARAPLAVGKDGSLTCSGEIPQGVQVCILDGERDSMVAAAGRAAEEARKGLGGGGAAAVLQFDGACRGMILDGSFGRETEAVRAAFPGVPVAGFLPTARSPVSRDTWTAGTTPPRWGLRSPPDSQRRPGRAHRSQSGSFLDHEPPGGPARRGFVVQIGHHRPAAVQRAQGDRRAGDG